MFPVDQWFEKDYDYVMVNIMSCISMLKPHEKPMKKIICIDSEHPISKYHSISELIFLNY
jgi:hypothetical protein